MLLDTDVFIDLLRRRPPALAWFASLTDEPQLSGVSALEASFGAQNARELAELRGTIARFVVIWPEPEDVRLAVDQLARYKLSHGLGSLDAITAAIALRSNVPVVTFNTKHFSSIPGVKVVQPYQR